MEGEAAPVIICVVTLLVIWVEHFLTDCINGLRNRLDDWSEKKAQLGIVSNSNHEPLGPRPRLELSCLACAVSVQVVLLTVLSNSNLCTLS